MQQPEQAPPVGDVPPSPWPRLAAALVAVQALVVLGAAVFYLVGLVVGKATAVLNVAMSVLLFAVAGAGLLLVARGLLQRRRWARAPAVTWEIVCVPVGYGLSQSGRWYVGVPLILMALAVLAGVFLAPPRD